MRLARSDLEAYRSTLIALGASAASDVTEALSGSDGTIGEMRQHAIDAIVDALGLYGEAAQALAAQLFDEVCAAEGIDGEARLYDGIIDETLMAGKVRYFSRRLVERDTAGYAADCGRLADFYVRRTAYEGTLRNCWANHVRYARVPTGPSTCDWCTMLASRGFVYYTRDTAYEGSHQNCDCIVVPGGPDTTVEGYDPDEYYARWRESGFMPPRHGSATRIVPNNLAGREPDWEYLRGGSGGTRRSTRPTAQLIASIDSASTMDELRRIVEATNADLKGYDQRSVQGIQSAINRATSRLRR